MKIKFDMNTMKYISIVETLTTAHVKDCLEQGEKIVLIIKQGDIAKAIGKQGSNIKKITDVLKRKIKIIEYNEDLLTYVKNVIMPIKAEKIEQDGETITITSMDSASRGMLIGRGAINLRGYEEIIKRTHPIKEIKVI